MRHEFGQFFSPISEFKFSDVSFGKSQLEEMMKIFSEYPKAFDLLTDAAKAPIRGHANKELDYFASCLFLSPSPEDHVEEIRRRLQEGDEDVSDKVFERLCNSLRDTGAYSKALLLGTVLYGQSGSFDAADSRFRHLIRPFINDYTREHVESFLSHAELNNQTWGRGRAANDHQEIKRIIDSRFPDLSLKAYPRFIGSFDS